MQQSNAKKEVTVVPEPKKTIILEGQQQLAISLVALGSFLVGYGLGVLLRNTATAEPPPYDPGKEQ